MNGKITLHNFNEQFPNEQACIAYLEKLRWNGSPVCPHCNCTTVYRFKNRNLLKCGKCRKQFTVRIGTIFEDSRLPLKKWFLAIYLLTSLKKGISSIQLGKYLDVTQKTAWFVLQRIRYAVSTKSFNKPLEGEFEADETYYGGTRRGSRGRGANGKTAIFGLAQRKGEIRCEPVENVKSKTILPLIRQNVKIGSTVLTDEFLAYNKLSQQGYNHLKVNHRLKEYSRNENAISINTNHLENFWKHFKRGIDAIYIHVSRKHIIKYCNEYSFRFNTRDCNDTERFTTWFSYIEIKRLSYNQLTS